MSSYAPIEMTPAPPGWVAIVGDGEITESMIFPVIGWAVVRNFIDTKRPNAVVPIFIKSGEPTFAEVDDVWTQFDEARYLTSLERGRVSA